MYHLAFSAKHGREPSPKTVPSSLQNERLIIIDSQILPW